MRQPPLLKECPLVGRSTYERRIQDLRVQVATKQGLLNALNQNKRDWEKEKKNMKQELSRARKAKEALVDKAHAAELTALKKKHQMEKEAQAPRDTRAFGDERSSDALPI